jgi:hypothetical protein
MKAMESMRMKAHCLYRKLVKGYQILPETLRDVVLPSGFLLVDVSGGTLRPLANCQGTDPCIAKYRFYFKLSKI